MAQKRSREQNQAIYARRKARAESRGTTYGRIRYQQAKAKAAHEGYPSVKTRERAIRDERRRMDMIDRAFDSLPDDVTGDESGLPDRDETDRRITNLMIAKGVRLDDLFDVLNSDDRWAAFRAWYARRTGWAA